jgi:tripartite ATP-independent transporter DctP family solute receptor
MTASHTRRSVLAGVAATAGLISTPAVLRAQATVIRWGELLAATHPQVQMADRIAKEVKEKTSGRIDIQLFPGGQLGSGKDMIESVSAGALQLTTDGAGALGAFLPQLSLIEAPYLWRDAAHLAKVSGTALFVKMNDELVAKRGMRMLNVTYYGKRHLTTGNRPVRVPADMAGFKLRVPPVDVFQAMAGAWGARATPIAFPELYLALSQGAVDGQENPLPTIVGFSLQEVQKFVSLTEHVRAPEFIYVNARWWKGLPASVRDIMTQCFAEGKEVAAKAIADQQVSNIEAIKKANAAVNEVDVAAFRARAKPVLDRIGPQYLGADTYAAILRAGQ